MRHIRAIAILIFIFLLNSCATKKEILYVQDFEKIDDSEIVYGSTTIQPNDILRITVGAFIPESALPYNRNSGQQNMGGGNVELLQLDGYLVTINNTIEFPVLGTISTQGKTVLQMQDYLQDRLINGGHLKNPNVIVRILNAKVTILGEVNAPGTYIFTEQNINILQALGYASDLTINGKREDVKIIREVDGNRRIATIDLTDTDFINSEFYQVKPNDLIIVNQNQPKVKTAGYIGNLGTLLSVFTIILSTTILITR